jgi:geranylgeranyl diphosphate synthase type II
MPPFSLAEWSAPRREAFDLRLLARFSTAFPPRLQDACRYPIEAGGKRYRPLLVLAAAESIVGADRPVSEAAWLAGVALELVHTYSLVHDDLPAMDNDDFRRGRPTVHKVYGDGPAILVGDALLTAAFEVLASPSLPANLAVSLLATLAQAAGAQGMIAGQALDVGMAGPVRDLDTLMRLHRAKTGALIHAAARMGGLAEEAEPEHLRALEIYGSAIGLAFQIADDVLDADEDADEDGPPSYVKLLGLDGAREKAKECLSEALAAIADLPHPATLAAFARYTVERET